MTLIGHLYSKMCDLVIALDYKIDLVTSGCSKGGGLADYSFNNV